MGKNQFGIEVLVQSPETHAHKHSAPAISATQKQNYTLEMFLKNNNSKTLNFILKTIIT